MIYQPALENWTVQGSCSISTKWSLKLSIRKSPKRITKIKLAEFKRMRTSNKQLMCQIFSFFNIRAHVNLNDLLNVELYNDNLKMINRAWEATLVAIGNDLDEGFVG